jgi:O-6-methylguanine DNA methyltransferase
VTGSVFEMLPDSIAYRVKGACSIKDSVGSMYRRIYSVVLKIPPGRVATYGQIARIAGRCSARNVGYAMSSVPVDTDVPWHRVINSTGRISIRSDGRRCEAQRQMLISEGVIFDRTGRVDLEDFGWRGPEGVHGGE